MSHRTQIPLTDSQYARLEREKVEVLAGMRSGEKEATR
jgi:hypothetical protein